jgi:hypothetical protein
MSRQRRRAPGAQAPSRARGRLVLDSGGLTAVASGSQLARAFVRRAVDERRLVVVPAVCLAESTTGRGPEDAPVNRVVAAAGEIVVADERVGRRAGEIRYRKQLPGETIDALVVAEVIEDGRPAVILTGERRGRHVRTFAEGFGHVRVESV